MSWTTPLTASANATLTAGQWNASVRDNLGCTGPAVSTGGHPRILVTDGTGQVAQRQILADITNEKESTTSTSYIDLTPPGPTVTMDTGFLALVFMVAQISNSSATNTLMSYDVTGASTVAASTNNAIQVDGGAGQLNRHGCTALQDLDPGSNTFTGKYKVTGGTGTFYKRRLAVMGL